MRQSLPAYVHFGNHFQFYNVSGVSSVESQLYNISSIYFALQWGENNLFPIPSVRGELCHGKNSLNVSIWPGSCL